jgi:hypothetical protein
MGENGDQGLWIIDDLILIKSGSIVVSSELLFFIVGYYFGRDSYVVP